ncbi:MAG: hypothetical protein JXA42_07370 [Anaerolineales bacterium]|nr:hypothetical protein [Anaerolineales bacterium]
MIETVESDSRTSRLILFPLIGIISLIAVIIILLTLGQTTAMAHDGVYAIGTNGEQPTIRYVAVSGVDELACTTPGSPCRTIQYAVDGAFEGDLIKVAAGVYTDVNHRAGLAQIVFLTKSLTLQGGFTTTDWIDFDPESNRTILDAEGQSRVLVAAGDISVTLEGFDVTGGDAEGLMGALRPYYDIQDRSYLDYADAGGGIYVISATTWINNCRFYNNSAELGGGIFNHFAIANIRNNVLTLNSGEYGGGMYFEFSDAEIVDNEITDNDSIQYGDGGGGIAFWFSNASVISNTILSNTAYYHGGGLLMRDGKALVQGNAFLKNSAMGGGAVCFDNSVVEFIGNEVILNSALTEGGGFNAWSGEYVISHNRFEANRAWEGLGGGLNIWGENAIIDDNILYNNSADEGGGLFHLEGIVGLNRNEIISNSARVGGGALLGEGSYRLNANRLLSNTAVNAGGMYLGGDYAGVSNTLIADNYASGEGSGLVAVGREIRIFNSTIARNTGKSSGVLVSDCWDGKSQLYMTNTILVGHSVGISVVTGCTATLEATLWGDGDWANMIDWMGGGSSITGNINLWETPGFVDTNSGDFRLQYTSAAIDAGVPVGLFVDLEGEPRPQGYGYDIGADEFTPPAPTRIEIVGPVYATVGFGYPFQAIVEPSWAGVPITYVWQATGQMSMTHTVEVVDRVTYTWGLTGTKWITVTASNSQGSVRDVVVVAVREPLVIYLPVLISRQ